MFSRRLSSRFLCTSARLGSQAVSNRVIVPPASHFQQRTAASAKLAKKEYRQLPENCGYIENFYNELEQFSNDFLTSQLNKSYSDFDDCPEDLVFEIDKYIETRIIPRHSVSSAAKQDARGARPPIVCETVSDKLVIERFLDFSNGVKLTLRMNGGYTFIFDVMLQGKAAFDQFEAVRKC
ncbi:Fmp23p [Lachancea thermotolerans CBS 6340]|uniref:KLTH0C07832p n=1 Tax=Lachancea thermotolerans (strain ATCC 56472 / CBS 6340 / NRRL Y-8284) TaxID=559295 RepID=C5DEB5_LACTC|nr:KLTH0C07832p [Lachancea thermotolerans CBS 6340]CAR22126.1 KLTH0C07832p [Lachancea thermotolerans CBS 6340]